MILPPSIADQIRPYGEHLEEITLDLDQPIGLRYKGEELYNHEVTINKDHIDYITTALKGFAEDNRNGIEGTLHRISLIRNRYRMGIGITIRVGRFITGLAAPLIPYLDKPQIWMLVIGAPGTGKTTLLRDIVREVAAKIGRRCVVVDTSNEIGGDGNIPHPGIQPARRLQVREPKEQSKTLMEAVKNHSAQTVIIDEIGYHDDVHTVQDISRRGVGVIATIHGDILEDLLTNPTAHPLIGDYDRNLKKRMGKPTFKMALEVRAKGVYKLYPHLDQAIDALCEGSDPEYHILSTLP